MARALSLIAVGALLLGPAGARAAEAWRIVTDPHGANIDQVGLLRTGDGVLHLAWHHRTGPGTEDLVHTAISPAGVVGATSPIVSGWSDLQNPALVPDPAGLRVFFGGIRSTTPGEPNNDLNTSLSSSGGASWALAPGSVAPPGGSASASPVSATVLPDAALTPLQAWGATPGTFVHSGLTPATPLHDFQAQLRGNYGYDPGLATDASGRAAIAWYSNASGALGVHAQAVAGDGAPAGSPATMPGTQVMSVGQLGRTPIVARAGGGLYVAYATGYPALNAIALWRVGAPVTTPIARAARLGNAYATAAAAADGRVWVVWKDTVGGAPHVLARRSNRAVTAFGATVDAGAPAQASSAYRLDASAIGPAVDVLGTFAIGSSPDVATWYRRLLPGLTVTARPRTLGRRVRLRIAVRDAGDAVPGAAVRAAGAAATTGPAGTAALRLRVRPGTGVVRVRVSAPGYTPARLRVRVGG